MVVLLFSPFIILPAFKSGLDVWLLAFLGAAAEQNDEAVSVLAEINAVAGPEIDAAVLPNVNHLYGNIYVTILKAP
jgi:hypothetical protein